MLRFGNYLVKEKLVKKILIFKIQLNYAELLAIVIYIIILILSKA